MSLPIQPGFYVIVRDDIGIDNKFATRVGIDLPIVGRSNQSNATEDQRWEVRRHDDDSFTIISPHFIPGPLAGFGIDEIRPGEPVKFKLDPSAWVIKPVEGERMGYSIQIVGSPPGAIYAIDLERREGNEELVLKPFPVIAHPPPLPGWSFIPVLQD